MARRPSRLAVIDLPSRALLQTAVGPGTCVSFSCGSATLKMLRAVAESSWAAGLGPPNAHEIAIVHANRPENFVATRPARVHAFKD